MTGGIHIFLCYFSNTLDFGVWAWREDIKLEKIMSVNGCDNAPAWPRDNALGRHLDHFLFHIEFIWGGKQHMDLSHTLFLFCFLYFL